MELEQRQSNCSTAMLIEERSESIRVKIHRIKGYL